ncbi:OmpA family protein [Actinomyces oris]|uniref:OmpA family protein n=1 Tax=Actinomyces oris TaxID=544580 RepID=UPI000A67CD12|nr:OmpA family protein [Actinomyces oris]
MLSSTTSSADLGVRLTRRSVLTLPALVGAGAVLAGCGALKKGGSASSGKGSGTASPRAALATATGPHGGIVLDAGWKGVPLSVEVGPAVVKDKYAIVRLGIVVSSKAKSVPKDLTVSQTFETKSNWSSMRGLKMLSMEKGLVFPELSTRSDGLTDSLTKDKPVELFPVFMAPGDGVKTVELFMPQMTVAIGIPVVEASAVDYSVDDVLAKAELDEADPGPFAMNSIVLSADGSSDTKKNEKSTTVTVDGDVTFETDSDQLSAQADAVLANVVEQIKKYPSGGELTITGHTDDVADDAHNQDLSERRAKAVSDRLKKLADLSTWKESVSGKGESSPRVTNDSDEHRQANRRVEITLTPSKPSEAAAAPRATASASSGVIPTPAGPVGKGAQGVDVTINNKTVHMSIDGVTRVGEYLTGTLMLTASEKVYVNNWEFLMPPDIKGPHSWAGWMMGVYNLTLLSAGQRYLGVDYSYSDGSWVMLSNDFVFEIQPGEATRFPVVWPDTGEDSVTLDLPAGGGVWERVAARLTDIPVVNA